ncbi:hypothetical protein M5K25_004553 [Dendrobium thyrsiflorum]|uniref:Retrovirus-related Pol polyprotein from transposon TNT 1-94 n=1 Tax=Dendrobium thyrsiflorum TaxID=117978 RepID=A0ABD0VM57_DENTH
MSEDGNISINPHFHIVATLSSTIAPLLPYILNLNTFHNIWLTIECCLQSMNHSKILQLKNELHKFQMNDKSMVQHLSKIKQKVDAIAAVGSSTDSEDIILYTLNGLLSSYKFFKTSIRTKLTPISLDDLYAFLYSEELNIATKTVRDTALPGNTS